MASMQASAGCARKDKEDTRNELLNSWWDERGEWDILGNNQPINESHKQVLFSRYKAKP